MLIVSRLAERLSKRLEKTKLQKNCVAKPKKRQSLRLRKSPDLEKRSKKSMLKKSLPLKRSLSKKLLKLTAGDRMANPLSQL